MLEEGYLIILSGNKLFHLFNRVILISRKGPNAFLGKLLLKLLYSYLLQKSVDHINITIPSSLYKLFSNQTQKTPFTSISGIVVVSFRIFSQTFANIQETTQKYGFESSTTLTFF